jgi:hypothetical protein
MMKRILASILIVLLFLPAPFGVSAAPRLGTLTSQPGEVEGYDSYVYQAAPDTNYETSDALYVGERSDGLSRSNRTYIYFDLSSIPADSVITSATLTLTIKTDISSNAVDECVYRTTSSWSESTITYNSSPTNDTTALDCTNIVADKAVGSEVVWDLDPAIVQEMIPGGSYTDYGFVIKNQTGSINDGWAYHSSSSSTAGYRPELVVDYTEPTPTPTSTPTNTATPTSTPTNTATPTNTLTPTPSSTPTDTPTPSLTPTPSNTYTPMPTLTDWPTSTATASRTATATVTPYPTFTPGGSTATATGTPYSSIIWAQGLAEISAEQQTAIETLLLAVSPPGQASNIYAVTDIREWDETTATISLINLEGIEAPYNQWSGDLNGAWMGSVVTDVSGDPIAYYYQAPDPEEDPGTGGSIPVLAWPYQPGYGASYTQGIHQAYGYSSIDIAPYGDAYAFAVLSGTVAWSCTSTYDQEIYLDTSIGTFVYMHLQIGSVAVGDTFTKRDPIAPLVSGSFSDTGASCRTYSTGTHIHLGLPGGYSQIQFESCVLSYGSGYFDCNNGDHIGVGGVLPVAGGYSPVLPTVGPGTPYPYNDDPSLVGGESHIWDGLINAVSKFISLIMEGLPEHVATGTVVAMGNAVQEITDLVLFLGRLQLLYWVPAVLIGINIMTAEVVRVALNIYRWVVTLLPVK